MHGQREPEQAAGLSFLLDDVTGVQVEGEHQAGLQHEEHAGEKRRGGQHLGAVQMFPLVS